MIALTVMSVDDVIREAQRAAIRALRSTDGGIVRVWPNGHASFECAEFVRLNGIPMAEYYRRSPHSVVVWSSYGFAELPSDDDPDLPFADGANEWRDWLEDVLGKDGAEQWDAIALTLRDWATKNLQAA